MKKLILALLLFCACFWMSGCDRHSDETLPVTEPTLKPIDMGVFLETFSEESTGRTIDYHLYIPQDATEQMPLMIYLHGIGEIGSPALNENNPLITNAKNVYGDKYPFIILAPTCNFSSWLSKEMPARVKALIDYIVDEYNIDREKIIITGHSMGSSGVFRLVETYGDYFSAAVPVSDPDVSLVDAESCTAVPIWAFAGSLENPFNKDIERLVGKIAGSGGYARYTEFENVKHGNTVHHAFSRDTFEWALSR